MPLCGYREIEEPKRKKVLIAYERLTRLLGFDSYGEVQKYHKKWVESYLGDGKNIRDEKWTKSIAVGSKAFVERVKSLMGGLAFGRKSIEVGESYSLREPAAPYGVHFGVKKWDIGPENTYLWDVNP